MASSCFSLPQILLSRLHLLTTSSAPSIGQSSSATITLRPKFYRSDITHLLSTICDCLPPGTIPFELALAAVAVAPSLQHPLITYAGFKSKDFPEAKAEELTPLTEEERKKAKRIEMNKQVGFWSETVKKGEQVFQSTQRDRLKSLYPIIN